MGKIIEKLKDLPYHEIIALSVIEQDDMLREIFTDEVNMSFNMLRTLSNEGKLSESTKNFIYDLFDKVILTKSDLIDKYARLANSSGMSVVSKPIEAPVIESPIIETPVIESPVVDTKTEPIVSNKKLPRRYGKAYIEKDIKNQGGKATNAQMTALAVNELKNIYVNLNARLINDMLTDSPKLTEENYREIRSAVTIVKNKLKDVLKKK
jgi:hypothetical protein